VTDPDDIRREGDNSPRLSERGWRLFGNLLKLLEHLNFRLLAIFAIVAAGGWGVAEIAEAVSEGEATNVDEMILLAFRSAGDLSDPIGSTEVEEAFRDITALGGITVTSMVALLASGFYLLDRRPKSAAFLIAMVAAGVGLVFALKFGFDRPRPTIVPHSTNPLSPSFPSGHTATASVVYLTIGGLLAEALPRKRLGLYVVLVAAFIAVTVGISRIYLGVHWPTDVLAGWTIGAVWASASWLLERDLRKRGWLEKGYSVVDQREAS
jgi:undecaprenyl-diphosphatase